MLIQLFPLFLLNVHLAFGLGRANLEVGVYATLVYGSEKYGRCPQ